MKTHDLIVQRTDAGIQLFCTCQSSQELKSNTPFAITHEDPKIESLFEDHILEESVIDESTPFGPDEFRKAKEFTERQHERAKDRSTDS